MVGLSPHTIRAWERRYAAVSPARTGSRQRRYRLEEVETLKRVKDLAAARGLSLRLAVAEAVGEAPELSHLPDIAPQARSAALDDAGPWRAVADFDPRLLVILDLQGQVVDCNVSFARLTGALRFELRGRRFSELVDGYDRAKAVAIYRGSPTRRLGWELNLLTEAGSGLVSFDCEPFRLSDRWLIACAGRMITGSH